MTVRCRTGSVLVLVLAACGASTPAMTPEAHGPVPAATATSPDAGPADPLASILPAGEVAEPLVPPLAPVPVASHVVFPLARYTTTFGAYRAADGWRVLLMRQGGEPDTFGRVFVHAPSDAALGEAARSHALSLADHAFGTAAGADPTAVPWGLVLSSRTPPVLEAVRLEDGGARSPLGAMRGPRIRGHVVAFDARAGDPPLVAAVVEGESFVERRARAFSPPVGVDGPVGDVAIPDVEHTVETWLAVAVASRDPVVVHRARNGNGPRREADQARTPSVALGPDGQTAVVAFSTRDALAGGGERWTPHLRVVRAGRVAARADGIRGVPSAAPIGVAVDDAGTTWLLATRIEYSPRHGVLRTHVLYRFDARLRPLAPVEVGPDTWTSGAPALAICGGRVQVLRSVSEPHAVALTAVEIADDVPAPPRTLATFASDGGRLGIAPSCSGGALGLIVAATPMGIEAATGFAVVTPDTP